MASRVLEEWFNKLYLGNVGDSLNSQNSAGGWDSSASILLESIQNLLGCSLSLFPGDKANRAAVEHRLSTLEHGAPAVNLEHDIFHSVSARTAGEVSTWKLLQN